MDLILLAGGKCPEEITRYTNISDRAALNVGDQSMAEIVIDAFKNCTQRIIMVGGQSIYPVDLHLPSQPTFTHALRIGLENVQSKYALVSTCDLPFIRKEHVEAFLKKVDPSSAAFHLSIVDTEKPHILFQKFKRTTLKTKEGRFTGGNIALIHKESALKVIDKVELMYQDRKSPLKYFLKTNLGICIRAALGQIYPPLFSVKNHIEPAASRLLGASFKAIPVTDPEIGTDIDNLLQYKTLEKMISS